MVVDEMELSNGDWKNYWSGSTESGALSNHCSNFSTLSGTGATIGNAHMVGTNL